MKGWNKSGLVHGKYVDLIVKGLEGNITTEMGLLIGDLADIVRKSPDLVKEFENEDYSTLLVRINKLKGNDEFKKNSIPSWIYMI